MREHGPMPPTRSPNGEPDAPSKALERAHWVLTAEPLDPAPLFAHVSAPAVGALASFCGVVRDRSLGRTVRYLDYEAYPPMVITQLEKIHQEIRSRWAIHALAIAHRLGRVAIGEASVWIAVSSPHRDEALEACRYAIDRLKRIVPIWKKEYWEGGEVWIEHPERSYITRTPT